MATAKEQGASAEAQTVDTGDFAALLNKSFRPQSDHARHAVESAVKTLAEHALVGTKLISNDVVQTIESLVAEIDRRLSEQINKIMHHEQFQKVEGAWRGLHYLVHKPESD